MNTIQQPSFREAGFLAQHIQTTMDFYHPRVIDPQGGFFHFFRDDGNVYDTQTRHLVSSTRFIFNYCEAARYFDNAEYLATAHHGLNYLRSVHLNPLSGGYAWLIKDGQPVDKTNHCYGLAFVLLAYASAAKAGIVEAKEYVHETFALMERYWDWYDNLWTYAWEQFVDHEYGAWYRILTCENIKYDNLKSPAGKTDYHTMGACYEVLRRVALNC